MCTVLCCIENVVLCSVGLSDTEEEALRQAFVECGDVEAVRIVRDSKTGAGKGFGFILFKVS